MSDFYFRPGNTATGEITEKKSRFIAVLAPADTEEEAQAFVASVRKSHYSARHNCYAYIIGGSGEKSRFSDDGEPSGTAGRPMLDVMRHHCLSDAVAVVTRYFGGVLLGTGGLVRAYSGALEEAVENAVLVRMIPSVTYALDVKYPEVSRFMRLVSQDGFSLIDSEYGENVVLTVRLPKEKEAAFLKAVHSATMSEDRAVLLEEGWSEAT